MHIIAEHISCVVLPTEFQAAIDAGYNEIYVMTSAGIVKHHKLRGQSRHIRLKVESIPGYTEPTIQQEVSFLPAGRIPIALFDQVVAFFKQVMEVKKSELEAMAWICWNQTEGYHIVIPNQTVSKASASYDWSSLPAGTTIVVDIHSHNTMNAFFSGTDNRDDQNAIGFSGVVGKMNLSTPETVWRFNYRDKKLETKFENLFQVPAREVQEPNPDWIGKVTTPSYSGAYTGKNYGKGKADHLKDFQFKKGQGGAQSRLPFQGGESTRQGPQFHGRGLIPRDPITTEPGDGFSGDWWGMGAYPSLIGRDEEDERAAAAERALATVYEDPSYQGGAGLGKTVSVSEEDVANQSTENAGTLTERLMAFENDRYDEVAINHGTLVAEAFADIDNNMAYLQGKDSLIKDLMTDMMALMSDEGQASMFREIYHQLPSNEKADIQMNGI